MDTPRIETQTVPTNSSNRVAALLANLRSVIRGNDYVSELLLAALCSDGHVLIEDVPGVGKTTLAKALAQSIEGKFRRIQFTPDLLPTDVVGGMIFSANTGEFFFHPGPVFCNILLADEINRASPRTQSALLEAMNERQVTVEGEKHPLHTPFLVIATQNPVEYQGTYPLPEGQLDRFALKLQIGYPEQSEEIRIITDQKEQHPLENLRAVATQEDVGDMQWQVRRIAVEQSVVEYITNIVRQTREDNRVKLGASPRAALTLYRLSQALAFVRERDYVVPDDARELAAPVIAHRLILSSAARHEELDKTNVVNEIVGDIRPPV